MKPLATIIPVQRADISAAAILFLLFSGFARAGSSITTAAPSSSYRLEGTCREEGSDTPQTDPTGTVERYHSFTVTDASAKLNHTLRLCTDAERAELVEAAEAAANARTPLSAEEKEFWTESIVGAVHLKPVRCSVLENPAEKPALAILRTQVQADRKKKVTGNQLLTFATLQKNKSTRAILQFLSSDSDYDITRHVDVEHVCDLDGDHAPEIVLKDERYAGYNYWVLTPSPDFSLLPSKFVDGLRGD